MHPRAAINSANASRQAANSFWTDERVALLGQLAGQNLRAAEIAARIGDGCNRAMVIGKCRRVGIPLKGYAATIADNEIRLRQRKVERIRVRITKLLQQIIAIQLAPLSRVSRETSERET